MTRQPRFTIEGFNIIRADYGEDADDFSIYMHCEISRTGDAGGEAFSATVVSPKRLLNTVHHEALFGRGLIVTQVYDEKLLRDLLEPLLADLESWENATIELGKYFDWI